LGRLEILIPKSINQSQLEQLRSVIGKGPVLILTHDSPDPDALSSGLGLATLFRQAWDIPSRLVYSGLVARAENRAMLRFLTPEWEQHDVLEGFEQYSALALVDSQPRAGNNRLPEHIWPQVVIDHHNPIRESLQVVPYVDVRPEVGATVSMVFQYLDTAGIVPGPTLATAMFYGLQTDTRGLARGASEIDEAVYVKLLSWLDRKKLIDVEQVGVSQDYFRAFSQGLQAAHVYGKVVLAYLGPMSRPDLTAEMADVLIRLETARAAFCLGYFGDYLHLSLRTKGIDIDAGRLVQQVVASLGKAGGHGAIAGGQVPIAGKDLDTLVAEIKRRFLTLLGEEDAGVPLLG
jgi:nanoRNase/pAp phosphatase (c-di-AMP/oligoRNAs hydrolase)